MQKAVAARTDRRTAMSKLIDYPITRETLDALVEYGIIESEFFPTDPHYFYHKGMKRIAAHHEQGGVTGIDHDFLNRILWGVIEEKKIEVCIDPEDEHHPVEMRGFHHAWVEGKTLAEALIKVLK